MKKIYEKANIREINKFKSYLINSLKISSVASLNDNDKETIIHLINRYKVLEKWQNEHAEAQR